MRRTAIRRPTRSCRHLYALSSALLLAASAVVATSAQQRLEAGPNINMVGGPAEVIEGPPFRILGDPYLQRQNEPSLACSSRNPLTCLGAANDYRPVDIAGQPEDRVTGDAWIGIFWTRDGGASWQSTLLPGFPQDTSAEGQASPIQGWEAAADPTVRAGTNGLLYVSGIAFNRDDPSPFVAGGGANSAAFVSIYVDDNNGQNLTDPPRYVKTVILAEGTPQTFVDKPWAVADIPRDPAAFCTIPGTSGAPALPPPPPPIEEPPAGKAFVCHLPPGNPDNPQTITVDEAAVPAHFDHGDTLGACPTGDPGGGDPPPEPPDGIPDQVVPAGALYMLYTVFEGDPDNLSSRLIFRRSADCGDTWDNEVVLNEGIGINQSGNVQVDPVTGTVYVAWREFAKGNGGGPGPPDGSIPSRILMVRSEDGIRFDAPVVVVDLGETDQFYGPFDLGVLPSAEFPDFRMFRTNSYPDLCVDSSGLLRMVWSQRGVGPEFSSRIVMATSRNGVGWSRPVPVDNHAGVGHQFMPAIACHGTDATVVWYDQRRDAALVFGTAAFDAAIVDGDPLPAHTLDVYAAETDGARRFAASTTVSRYVFKFDEFSAAASQVQFHPANWPLYAGGTVPFLGDYLALATADTFAPPVDGQGWRFVTDPDQAPTLHAAWTDNRDVVPPLTGDWRDWGPVDTGLCVPGNERSRNQNIYTSRLTHGLVVGALGNSRPLSSEIQRGFVVFVQNTTGGSRLNPEDGQTRLFRLVASQPDGGRASFTQSFLDSPSEPTVSLDVEIAARSSIARTVFVTAGDPTASVMVEVFEIDGDGNAVSNGLQGVAVINPDPTAPPPLDAGVFGFDERYGAQLSLADVVEYPNPTFLNPTFLNPTFLNPTFLNPTFLNPTFLNADGFDALNPTFLNPTFLNPTFLNPTFLNPTFLNPTFLNPTFLNPTFLNQALDGKELITDVSWQVSNTGNVPAAYNFNTLIDAVSADLIVQLIVYRVLSAPTSNDCALDTEFTGDLVTNVVNPTFLNPTFLNPTFLNPTFLNTVLRSDVENTTFALGSGEVAFVTLRVAHNPGEFQPEDVQAAVIAQGVDPLSDEAQTGEASTTATNDLVLGMVGPSAVAPGATVNYAATVVNTGLFPATRVTLTDNLPAGVSFVSAVPSQGSCSESTGVVTCDLGTVPNGATGFATVDIAVETVAIGALTNTAAVIGADIDPDLPNNIATVLTDVTGALAVNVNTGGYPGKYRIDGQPFVQGSAVFDLAPGIHTWDNNADPQAAENGFQFQVDPLGQVTSLNAVAGTGAGDTLTLNTAAVTIDPGAYDGYYELRGSMTKRKGLQALTLVKGVTYLWDNTILTVGSPSHQIPFSVDAAGMVTTTKPSSATGVADTLQLANSDVEVDPESYIGYWVMPSHIKVGEDSGTWTFQLVDTVTLVPGLRWQWGNGAEPSAGVNGRFFFTLDDAGDVVNVSNPVAAQGNGNRLELDSVQIVIEPGTYTGEYTLRNSFRQIRFSGTQLLDLVAGLEWKWDNAALGFADAEYQFAFAVDGVGDVTSLNPASGQGIGNQLQLNPVTVTIDPQAFTGQYRLGTSFGGLDIRTGQIAIDLVPGMRWLWNNKAAPHIVGSTEFGFDIDDLGNVVAVTKPVAAFGIGDTLRLNNVTVTIDPQRYVGRYRIRHTYPNRFRNQRDVVLVPGLRYQLANDETLGDPGQFQFDVDGAGNVTSADPVSGIGVGTTLRLNNVDVLIDPGGFTGNYRLGSSLPIIEAGPGNRYTGPTAVTLVPGLRWVFDNLAEPSTGLRQRFQFDVDGVGAVTSLSPGTGLGVGSSLALQCVTVDINPTSYGGNFRVPSTYLGTFSGFRTLPLIPGLAQRLEVPGGIVTGGGENVFRPFTSSVDPTDLTMDVGGVLHTFTFTHQGACPAASPVGAISGRVTAEATGEALEGIKVFLFDDAGVFLSQSAVTDANGDFSLPTDPGTYHLTASNNAGWVNQLYDGIDCPLGCAVVSGAPIVLDASAVASGVDFSLTASPLVFPVTSAADNGAGTLREAILLANAHPGPDSITFDLPVAGLHTITPATALPVVTGPLTVDGTTQAGYAGSPVIELDGSAAGAGANGLYFTAGTNVVRGLAVNRFDASGLRFDGAGGNLIEGNYLGTDPLGTVALGNNRHGLEVRSPNNTIGGTTALARNIVSGNAQRGVHISASLVAAPCVPATPCIDVSGNVVTGNYIGTDATGGVSLGNGLAGVLLFQAIGGRIGGPGPGEGNVISGNGTSGVAIAGDTASTNVVAGNFIGTDATGSVAIANDVGVAIRGNNAVGRSHDNVVGGPLPGDGNLISGNVDVGVVIAGRDNQVMGNLIGTKANGTEALGNEFGVVLRAGPNNVVGGAAANVLSGNTLTGISVVSLFNETDGAFDDASGNTVSGNMIGTDASGAVAVPNGTVGIYVDGGLDEGTGFGPADVPVVGTLISGNTISGNTGAAVNLQSLVTDTEIVGNSIGTDSGGTLPLGNDWDGVRIGDVGVNGTVIGGDTIPEANTIAFNGGNGVTILGGTGHSVLANAMFDNAGLGIDISDDGVTPNDALDGDLGPNDLQNFPVLTLAVNTPTPQTLVSGTLDSSPSTQFTIEFFASASCDGSGNGEGATFVGSTTVTTNGTGSGSFSLFAVELLEIGDAVTATATDPAGNTSEFSACELVQSSL